MSAPAPDDNVILSAQRQRIDAIDSAIVALLAERMATVAEVVELKAQHGLAAALPARVEAVLDHVRSVAAGTACPPELAAAVWRAMIDWTIAHEEQTLPGPTKERAAHGQH